MHHGPKLYGNTLSLLVLVTLLLAACGGSGPVAREELPAEDTSPATTEDTAEDTDTDATDEDEQGTAETDAESAEVEATDEMTDTAATASESASGSFTTPHPILSTHEVRQAIAYCTNRPELIQSVYPFLSEEEQAQLLMDTFIPKGHWAEATENITAYPFDPEQGSALLEEAGWTLEEGETVRTNAAGDRLELGFLSTDAQFRQTWAAVFEQQLLENCGMQIIRDHSPGTYVFGSDSGLARREYELAAYAWVGSVDPKGGTLYACNQIPRPENNWEGQNTMGWCNERASEAILAANNTLDREERKRQYAIVQEEFTNDMVSLPLFNRVNTEAASTNLVNFKSNPTENYTSNAYEWELADGGDEVVLGFSQEPSTLFYRTEATDNIGNIMNLIKSLDATGYSYDYQPVALQQLPTIENGGAVLEEVEVSEGTIVWSADGEPVELAPGVKVRDAAGDLVTYEGGTLTMPQLSVTFEYVDGLTWEDGTPVTQADFELTERINCDEAIGAVTYLVCDSRERIDFTSDTSYTIIYRPGALWPEYSVYNVNSYGLYAAHHETSDGRTLAEVPASEWPSLPEIVERPLSNGPYRIVEWQKGQRIVLEANPYFYKGEPAIKKLTIVFFSDTNQAVSQLLSGTIDALGSETLGAGPEVETVLQAAEEGRIQAYALASPTWEHVDMNIFLR